MEMTNREMIGHLNQLAIINEKLGGELNYKISRNKEKLTKEYEQFDKARQEAKKDYCELDEDGNIKQEKVDTDDENSIMKVIFLSDEKEKEWNKVELKMLDEEKVNIDIRTVSEDVIFNSEASQYATDAMLFMIKEDEEK
ncbi:hypothetical protein [Candidatus Stoquefichus sp. SB1]|jgi:hypothetical protein|uniref:Uncharacterized protein n=1 Tax=Siphoviridae sp. ctQtc11 TaxID=2825497 RepID=A0A8S5P4W7_9CAUD|nr:hypothetical protein [Candidatus Stoquefichus sp. SB1]DAE01483.1 MAG TPA: Protein of unknown function (DUF1617) [Siphoviridae sp. ctQtc11]